MNPLDPRHSLLHERVHRLELLSLERLAQARGGVRVSVLLELVDEQLAATRTIARELAEIRAAHARAHSEEQRRQLLERALQAHGAARRSVRAVRRGFLDLDALRERAASASDVHNTRVLLCLHKVAGIAQPPEAALALSRLCELVGAAPASLVECAAAEALATLLGRPEAGARLSEAQWQRVSALLVGSSGSRRAQAALARAALTADRGRGLALLRVRLRTPQRDPDDFLLRQYFIDCIAALGPDADASALLAEVAESRDPSEHVRLRLPEALRVVAGVAALPLLGAMIAPGAEPSHRVRAKAGLSLIALGVGGVAQGFAHAQALLRDPDFRVRQIVAEELERVAGAGELPIDLARALCEAAVRAAACAEDGDAAEPALRLVEALAPLLDPALGLAHRELAPIVAALPRERSRSVRSTLGPLAFGRVLALLARRNFGLYAEQVPGGYRLTHGPSLVRRAWRIVYELEHRTPYKRQDQLHTRSRRFSGSLRAHSEQLGEATPTIPGEPLALGRDGGWGTHVPTVDDLLSTPLLGASNLRLFSARGVTTVTLPRGVVARLRMRLQLTRNYAALAADRNRGLQPADPSDCSRYRERLEQLGVRLEIEAYPQGPAPSAAIVADVARNFDAKPSAPLPLSIFALPDVLTDGLRYLLSPSENTLGQLAVGAAALGAGLVARNVIERHRIQRDRAAIPLVIGGWGTRGKSGTERLKAAMLHGQGVRVLVKTTGCEAMFIHGVPGRRPTEIFIPRSYDKATIWEQRQVLRLAARLNVHVFLWECMALTPALVETLQDAWTRDDLSTLTNAYPDHEDIQGPTGHDVATVISRFIRKGGTVITSEEQMLPILEEEARRKRARLLVVPRHDHELLADDLLARFPYSEHPRNIALVRRLATELGLDPDLATADMADHVVPDLGVLKTYATAEHRGRRFTFINGMSANERKGFLSNWQRMQCEQPLEATVERGHWTVIVINNRYDRVARSQVFAEILVRDACAERHVLIGTNLAALRRYVEQALGRLLDELQLFQADDSEPGVTLRCKRMRHRLRIGPASTQALLAELAAWTGTPTENLHGSAEAALADASRRADAGESFEAIAAAVLASPVGLAVRQLPDAELGAERARFFARSAARRVLFANLEREAHAAIADVAQRPRVNARQRALYRALFLEMLVLLENPAASGDQVIDFIAGATPPGTSAKWMGTQNIKGTGLDFVYRFLRYDEVTRLVERLARADHAGARVVLEELTVRVDWGMLDIRLASDALQRARQRFVDEPELVDLLSTAIAQVEAHAQRMADSSRGSGVLRRLLGQPLDAFDAILRRWRADALLDALVHEEISHERAALEARRLVEREKKGWRG